MRPALGRWDQGSERHRLNRERVQFCGTSLPITYLLCTLLTFSLLGYDGTFYDHRLCGGLRDPWQVAAFGSDPDMLGRPVCKLELDVYVTASSVSIEVSC